MNTVNVYLVAGNSRGILSPTGCVRTTRCRASPCSTSRVTRLATSRCGASPNRTLLCGDVFFNLRRLGPPPAFLTFDPERNHELMRRLAALRPALVLFGHGPPLRDPDRLAHLAGRVPSPRQGTALNWTGSCRS